MPIDFTAAASKLAKLPRDIDYLVYIKDEHWSELNDWEKTFVPSVIKQVRSSYGTLTALSPKQHNILDKMIVKFKLRVDEWCVRGYADRTDGEVLRDGGTGTTSTKMAQAGEKDDDFEDDIPF